MKRVTILCEKPPKKEDIHAFFEDRGSKTHTVIIDKYEFRRCASCGKLIIHPVVVDGRYFGSTCAGKVIRNAKLLNELWEENGVH